MSQISRTYTFTDGTTAYGSQVESEISNIVTTWNNHDSGVSSWQYLKASTQGVLHGTSTNDDAAAGYIGEYLSSIVNSYTTAPASTQFGDLTSLSITAGDWDVTGIAIIKKNTGNFSSTELALGISTTTGNSSTGLVFGSNAVDFADFVPTTFTLATLVVPVVRISIAATTTHYLKGYVATYGSGTPQFQCRISARRVR